VPTSETGTRHRTAERVARSIDVPVVAVSEDMAVLTVYVGDDKKPLEPIPRLLSRANTALQTLERYKTRLDATGAELSTAELEDVVAIRDVVTMLQITEMVLRIAEEIESDLVELGTDGRLVRLQLEEIVAGVEDERRLVVRDYFHGDGGWHIEQAMDGLQDLDTQDLLDVKQVADVLHLPMQAADLDASLQPKGYRLLSRIPRLPDTIIEHIIEAFGDLSMILRASVDDLDDVEGVGAVRAKAIKDGLSKLTSSSILDRYS
jgi:diadenylate cyclase